MYEHATPALVPLVEAGSLSGPAAETTVAAALAPLVGERDADGESIFPRPAGASIDTLLLGCTHYPLLAPLIQAVVGDGVAVVDSATATASAVAQMLGINGLEAPAATEVAHRQLTTGDPGRFREIAARMFGDEFPGRVVDRSRRGGPMSDRSASRGPAWRDDRVWQAGFLIGSALGAAATVVGRHAERSARRGLVDWPAVERIAIARLASAPGTLPAAELRALEPAYVEAMATIVPALTEALGTELPGVVERSGVVDRADWVRANTATFASLIGKLEADLLDQVVPPGGGLAKASMAIANRWVTTRQLGYLLGFMGSRVLGQYDLALLSAEQTPGRLLFVEENIRATAASLRVPVGPFRTWIALHETTHAFEFEAHPWLRPYLSSRLERQLTLFGRDARGLGREALRGLGRTLRGEADGEHWMERLMGDEQRRLFRETQAVMSLLEGFSDYVMDEVGKGLVPGVEQISAKFHERRNRRTAFERSMLRLTGMDLKLEQYKKGERFVRAIAEARGRAALTRLWDGPETLPRDGEIEAPERWVARVMDASAGA